VVRIQHLEPADPESPLPVSSRQRASHG
jgi:hypothetical protein